MGELAGKVVLLTGAGGGLGTEFTRQLLAAGCRMVLADRPGAALPAGPPGVLGTVEADLAAPGGADELHRAASAIAGAPDIVIHNAGLAGYGRLEDVPAELLERLMRVNLLAPMRLTALLLPAMRARGSGHVVNIASVAGLVGVSGLAPYCTSKFGLRGFGNALRDEAGAAGVAVTNVYPFFTRTPILQSEQYGQGEAPQLPERLIEEPGPVVAEIVAGIRARRAHVYPGRTAKTIALLERVAPWALRLLG